jgi:hypothetical protein
MVQKAIDASDVKQKHKTKTIEILHNGQVMEFPFERDELVGALLAKAIESFEVLHNPHLQALFDAGGHELADAKTLHEEKVKAGEELVLRQSTVKGG